MRIGIAWSHDSTRQREELDLQQQRDFEHGRTVDVAGWQLSETEARLCALTTLIDPER
jgi:hypothetical protein